MTFPRSQVIRKGEDGNYHCWSRCVRRALLCGEDPVTGKNFDHRRDWIRERLKFLSNLLSIEVLAYSLMPNHQHLLLRVLHSKAVRWTPEEVAFRWLRISNSDPSEQAFKDKLKAIVASKKTVRKLRQRLSSVSWFMKLLNERTARRANLEDGCTGSFWQGRFKAVAVKDEVGLLACSVYIDLNPIRAKLAATPEASDFTSIQERIASMKTSENLPEPKDLWITPIHDTPLRRGYLSVSLVEYLQIVDLTGRRAVSGKPGVIAPELQPILQRLHINPETWEQITSNCRRNFSVAMGRPETLVTTARETRKEWVKGIALARQAFR